MFSIVPAFILKNFKKRRNFSETPVDSKYKKVEVFKMIGWVKDILVSILPESVGQGAETFEKKTKPQLIDVSEGVSFVEEARRQSVALMERMKKSGTKADKLRAWIKARRKVKENLADFYDIPGVMEEVTERMIEAAEFDPFYKKLFS